MHESDKRIVLEIQNLLDRNFKECKYCMARQDKNTCSIVMELIPTFDLTIIDKIIVKAGKRLVDLRIWGIGYAPKSTTSEKWQPLTLEIVLSKHGYNPDRSDKPGDGIDNSNSNSQANIPTIDLNCIEKKSIRRIVQRFLICLALGDRPDVYQQPVQSVTYSWDSGRNMHMVMIESVPTLNLSFIKKIRFLFSGSLCNIVFERRSCSEAGKFSDTDSATTMIVEIFDTPSCGYERAKPPRKEKAGYSPY